MTSQLASRILAVSLVLGVLANWLLKVDSWRAGFVVWMTCVIAVTLVLSERASGDDDPARRERRVLLGSAFGLSLLLVLRDASTLYAVDFFALLVTLFLMAWRAFGRSLATLEPRDALLGVVAAASTVVAGGPTLLARDTAPDAAATGWRRAYRSIGLGALAAAPVLVAVTLLLANADPLFAGFLEEAGTFLEQRAIENLLFITAASWVTAGALRGSLTPIGVTGTTFQRQLRLTFPIAAPLLGGLALLLSAWIGLQVRTLFGGAEYVATTAGVTVAQYAREGFFELIVIAGIVLAALLVADDLLEREPGPTRVAFQRLGTVLVLLVGAVLASAVARLALYLRYYGLTDDRVLALAVLVWVALVLGWFALTVLRGARDRFAPGVLVASALWLATFNVANPERWVVETNLRRAEAGLEFDIPYHARLSADALPALQDGAARLGTPRADELRAALDQVWAARAETRADWRLWSVPYALALRTTRP